MTEIQTHKEANGDSISVGTRVVATQQTDKRGGQRTIEGSVIYLSQFGWVTIALSLGYQESFWISEVQPAKR